MATANPYAAPQAPLIIPRRVDSRATAQGAWRNGQLLVVARKAVLPDRCVKCNAPAAGYRKRVKLRRYSPWLVVAFFLSILPLIMLALLLLFRKRVDVRLGMCRDHVRQRRLTILFAWLAVLATFVILFMAAALDVAVQLLGVALVGLLVAVIYAIFSPRIVTAKKIDKNFAWVKGACPQYLAALPDFEA